MEDNSTNSSSENAGFESKITLIVGITYFITFIVGIIGNSLVLLTILLHKQMRSTTNILILNLAIAELFFLVLCVPFTGLNYVLSVWYFGDIFCRIVQYTSNVTAYVIVMLLVMMSLDRYLAIYSLKRNIYRSKKYAVTAVSILWCIVLIANLPNLYLHQKYGYKNDIDGENRTVCILKFNIILTQQQFYSQKEINEARLKVEIYFIIFIMFAYVIPCISIVFLYGLIMIKLKNAKGQQVSKSKRKVTLMVIVVVLSFVLCWGPLQFMFFLQHVVKKEFQETEVIVLVISNCIGYLNACINPIIYGFANPDFRSAYAAILRCEFHNKKYVAVGTQINRHELNRLDSHRSESLRHSRKSTSNKSLRSSNYKVNSFVIAAKNKHVVNEFENSNINNDNNV